MRGPCVCATPVQLRGRMMSDILGPPTSPVIDPKREVTQLYREGFAGLVRHKGHAVALQETRECWPGALAFVEATEATVASSSEEQDSSEELE